MAGKAIFEKYVFKIFHQEKNKPRQLRNWRGLMKKIPAATYSCGTYRPTTIGAAAFHFRVRNGTGWDHCALATGLQGEDLFVSSSCLPGSPAFLGASE